MPRNNLLHKVLIESPRALDINNKQKINIEPKLCLNLIHWKHFQFKITHLYYATGIMSWHSCFKLKKKLNESICYCNMRVPTQVNTSQHISTRIQHKSTQIWHESTRALHESTRINTSITWVNTGQNESTWVNTSLIRVNTNQSKSKMSKHESNISQHESTLVKTRPRWVNPCPKRV